MRKDGQLDQQTDTLSPILSVKTSL